MTYKTGIVFASWSALTKQKERREEMKREEVIKKFAVFIADGAIKIIEGKFYEEIFSKMSCASSKDDALDVFIGNIFANVFLTLEQFQEISQQELSSWGNKQLPRFRKFFRSHSPKKILREKEAVKKVIYFILKEFIKDEVVEEFNGWTRQGELTIKLKIVLSAILSGKNR